MKRRLTDFALLGGTPTFGRSLCVGGLAVGDRNRFLRRAGEILDRRRYTNDGPLVREFEAAVAARLNVRHALAVCNGTIALGITLNALGVKGEVILPAFTFVAASHVALWQGLTPVLCDVDLATHNITAKMAEELISPATSCILPVHLWGRPCDALSFEDLAGRNRLNLLFDASHALGCSHRNRPVGQFGDAEVFSFHATKVAHSFEGGIVATNDDGLAEKIRTMRDFGYVGEDSVVSVGINGKMTEICAAMGLTTLEALDETIAANTRNYECYASELTGLPGIGLIEYNRGEMNNFQYIVVDIDDRHCELTRDQMMAILTAENVLARRYFYPGLHRVEPYRSSGKYKKGEFSNTEALARRLLCLPTGDWVSVQDIEKICNIMRAALKSSSELKGFFPDDDESSRK